jgi:hypothetical protein
MQPCLCRCQTGVLHLLRRDAERMPGSLHEGPKGADASRQGCLVRAAISSKHEAHAACAARSCQQRPDRRRCEGGGLT